MCTIIGGTRVSALITAAGKRTLHYFALQRRVRNPLIRDLTPQELRRLNEFVLYPQLRPVIGSMVRLNLTLVNVEVDVAFAYPTRRGRIDDVGKMTSKSIRMVRATENCDPICIFKLGPIITPGELMSWTGQVAKLTSTRHRNILLRAMHGDIFSNSRLHKFGLRDSPACASCLEPIETIQHRIFECPKAVEAWTHLDEIKVKLNLTNTSDRTLESLIGLKDRLSKIELALHAEVIHKLATKSERYCPKQLAKAAVLLVMYSEHLTPDLNAKFKAYKDNN